MQKITASHSITSYQGFSTGRERGMGTITDVLSITAEGCMCVLACASIPRAEPVVRRLLHTQTLQKTARPFLMK